jgi:hypothetical protein
MRRGVRDTVKAPLNPLGFSTAGDRRKTIRQIKYPSEKTSILKQYHRNSQSPRSNTGQFRNEAPAHLPRVRLTSKRMLKARLDLSAL